ncbi:MAG: DegT/DnrJ/EryC1/StrS family aminotransferase [Verrucomicrobium sp.]|nr:DegT/DnrJ/EryC1/StrS family aminotransferase [Verrucomicrobium sp.]
MSTIPLFTLSRQSPEVTAGLRAAFERVLESGHYIMGPEVEALEKECAAYLGLPAEGVIAVSSGTDALVVALMALDIGPGDEVICPSYTFFATAGSVWRAGAKPVFVDSTPCCFNLDPAQVAAAITPRTKAIIPVHLFGQPADMDPILELARKNNLAVVEDAAQAIGAAYRGKPLGTLGEIGCYSFFPTKNLGALGDGGLVVSRDPKLAARLRKLRVHGMQVKYYHEEVGGNFRLDSLQAAFLRVKLPHLDAAHAARRRHAARYNRHFLESGKAAFPVQACVCQASPADLPAQAPLLLPYACDPSHIYNQYVVRVPGPGRRDALRAHLAQRGIGTEIYYPVPLHLQECFQSLGHQPGSLPWSERFAAETMALPIFPELAETEIDAVAAAILEFLA